MRTAVALAALCVFASAAAAFSTASVRFFGTGGGTAVDRIRVRIDPPVPADVGAGDFTVELWLRGTREDNATPTDGYRPDRQLERADVDWIYGNVVVDRDVFGPGPDWGMSIHRDGHTEGPAVLRFGTEGASSASQHTLQGRTHVLDGAWHHVAFVRERATGRKRIVVDGELDAESAPGASTDDLSYPDGRETEYPESDPYLVIGSEKHGYTAPFFSFSGHVDEIRVWSVARTVEELRAAMRQSVAPDTPGLALLLRLEEGSGQALADAAGGAPATLFRGVPGEGEWSTLTPLTPATPTTTTTTTPGAATTSTTLAPACSGAAACDDGDPCTDDRCEAGTCVAVAKPGLGGLACRLERLATGATCAAAEGAARVEAAVDARLRRARRLLVRSATAPLPRARRLVRRAAADLARARRAAARAARRSRITPACAASVDDALGALREGTLALLPALRTS